MDPDDANDNEMRYAGDRALASHGHMQDNHAPVSYAGVSHDNVSIPE